MFSIPPCICGCLYNGVLLSRIDYIDMISCLKINLYCLFCSSQAAASLLQVFAAKTSADLLPHVPALMRGLLKLFADPDKEVVAAAWEALNAVTKVWLCVCV